MTTVDNEREIRMTRVLFLYNNSIWIIDNMYIRKDVWKKRRTKNEKGIMLGIKKK